MQKPVAVNSVSFSWANAENIATINRTWDVDQLANALENMKICDKKTNLKKGKTENAETTRGS